MNNPTSKQVAKVLAVFEKVLPMATKAGHLDMMKSDVNMLGKCGTVHCHAGWFAIGVCDTSKPLDFWKGIARLNEMLSIHNVATWAEANPKIWGNRNGYSIFTSSVAFTPKDKSRADTLQDIYDHWAEVHDRLWLLENYLN